MRETKKFPLVVDLDGTLTATDTLMESVIRAIKRKPANLLRLPFWLVGGRAAFEAKIAEHADFRAEKLPYRESLIDYLVYERERGRKIVFATAAHCSIAEQVSSHLGLFDLVIATSDNANLKGDFKLAGIRHQIGDDFVYAGDSKADLPVWASAKGAVLAGVSPRCRSKRPEQYSCRTGVFERSRQLDDMVQSAPRSSMVEKPAAVRSAADRLCIL